MRTANVTSKFLVCLLLFGVYLKLRKEDEIFMDNDLDILNIIDYGFPTRRYERADYFHDIDDLSFFRRFRLTKPTVFAVFEQIDDNLEFDNDLNNSVSPVSQLLTTLSFYACDGHQVSLGDFMGFHQSTVSIIISKVSAAIANLRPHYIRMPRAHESIRIQQNFYAISRFPKVLGYLDGTHIRIQSPGGVDAEIYRNRKPY